MREKHLSRKLALFGVALDPTDDERKLEFKAILSRDLAAGCIRFRNPYEALTGSLQDLIAGGLSASEGSVRDRGGRSGRCLSDLHKDAFRCLEDGRIAGEVAPRRHFRDRLGGLQVKEGPSSVRIDGMGYGGGESRDRRKPMMPTNPLRTKNPSLIIPTHARPQRGAMIRGMPSPVA